MRPTFLAGMLLLSLGACDLETQTYTLTPDRLQAADLLHNYTTGVCSPFELDRRGLGSRNFAAWMEDLPSAGSPEVLVGYSSGESRGESCHLWVHHVFQGLMFFDMSELPDTGVITDATLRYDDAIYYKEDWGLADFDVRCLYEVGVPVDEWRTRALARAGTPDIFRGNRGDLIGARNVSTEGSTRARTAVDVTPWATRWRLGTVPNRGVSVTPVAANRFTEQDRNCTRRITNIRLEVTMEVPPAG